MAGDQVSDIVERVLQRIRTGEVADREIDMPGAPRGVFKTVDAAMDAAHAALPRADVHLSLIHI